MSGHVIVYGVRGVGLRTIEHLHAAGIRTVVVGTGPDDTDPVADALLAAWNVPRVTGRTREALAAARLDTAAAVVCVPDDDLRAMETALLVRRIRPDVRLVVRMGNSAVGRALAEVTGPGSVLDVAGLAAPSIVDACLGRRPRPMVLAGRTFVAVELVVDGAPATLRERYGELAPIAVTVTAADGRPETFVCPGRDVTVQAGDRVTAVGTPEQFATRGVAVDVDEPATPVRHTGGARSAGAERAAEVEEFGGKPGLLAMMRSLVAEADRALKATLLALVALALVSVLVLHAGYVKPDGSHMSWIDAMYFTVETIATVGYGDFNFAEQVPWLRVYAIGLMSCGVVLAAIWFALLTELLVSSRISRSFGQRRVGTMKGHVIVVGLGAIGVRVMRELLARGHRLGLRGRRTHEQRPGQHRDRAGGARPARLPLA
jgi:voltage-gated potassium channel Kch